MRMRPERYVSAIPLIDRYCKKTISSIMKLHPITVYRTVLGECAVPVLNAKCCFIWFHQLCFALWYMRKTTRLKLGWGFGQTNSPLSTARVLIDAVGLCLFRVSEVWRLFAPDLRRWINSFSGSDFTPRLVYKTWYFCYFFTKFDQQF